MDRKRKRALTGNALTSIIDDIEDAYKGSN